MTRILTGIQSSGRPHLGNLLGAIIPAIELSKNPNHESFFFIADLHALTSVRASEKLKENTYAIAAAWLACGFDVQKHTFYKQSDVPMVCELAWILSCLTPFPMLANAHSFKDKSEKLSNVNAGLFTYPVLMACDIILYDGDVVPVGKDQIQHLEMARDLAIKFNAAYGDTFIIPQAKVQEQVMTIPGTDGQKMSKSYGNIIDVFAPEKELKKQVMSIVTDSLPLESPKNPDNCNVFKIYSTVANTDQISILRDKYVAGNFGYGHAKSELLQLLLTRFEKERISFNHLMENKEIIDSALKIGAQKATTYAEEKMKRVRERIGVS